MILRTQRSLVAQSVDIALTVFAWGGFCYLIGGGIIAVLQEGPSGMAAPFWSKLLPTMYTLLVYLVAALFTGAVLIAWARYNRARYGGLDRRQPCGPLHDMRCSLTFCASPAQLMQLRASRLGIVHHDVDGVINAVEASASRLVLVSGAA